MRYLNVAHFTGEADAGLRLYINWGRWLYDEESDGRETPTNTASLDYHITRSLVHLLRLPGAFVLLRYAPPVL